MTARTAKPSRPTRNVRRLSAASELASQPSPAYARVCQQLRQDILAGRFAWGARLKILELVQRYGVSQMPVREALQKLQGEGLITIRPNCGACVRTIDEKFIADIYDLRGAIDTMLLRRAAERAAAADLRAMEIVLETHEQAERRGEFAASLEYNKQFHRVIYRMADNPDATEILDRYWDLIDALRRRFGFSPSFMSGVIAGHRQLLKAIADRDPNAAVTIAAANCQRSKQDLIERMRIGRQEAAPLPGAAPTANRKRQQRQKRGMKQK